MKVKVKYTLTALVIIVGFLAVGSCDYDDAVDSEERYKKAVCDGVWPDYLKLSPECEQPKELRR